MLENLCLVLGAFLFVNADELAIQSIHQCGKSFQLDVVESVTIRYMGGLSIGDRCKVEFTVESVTDYIICVQPASLDLDCGTEIRYHTNFVSEFTNEGVLACDMNQRSTYDETCLESVSTLYIAIFKDYNHESSGDFATIRVFAKEGSNDILETIIVLAILLPVILFMICAGVCVYINRRRRKQQSSNAQITYTTAVGATTVQTGGGLQYPSYTYQHAPGNQQSSFQGDTVQQSLDGYYVHPAVTSNTPPAPGPYNYQPVSQALDNGMQATPPVYPSAPSQDMTSVPPPSYDSLRRE